MSEHPIIFSAPMVRAILAGRKTQTRRLVRPAHATRLGLALYGIAARIAPDVPAAPIHIEPGACPYGGPGDRLWMRENVYIAPPDFDDCVNANATDYQGRRRTVGYAASMNADAVRCARDYGVKQTPCILMPRWASRLTLRVTGVRVERLQDITEADARSEGVEPAASEHRGYPGTGAAMMRHDPTYRRGFATLWDSINGRRAAWASDPWMWVVNFERVEAT